MTAEDSSEPRRRRATPPDARLGAARYRVDRLADAVGEVDEGDAPEVDTAGQTGMDQRAHYVEIAIQQAIRRGDFDDLPGAGKPLPMTGAIHDPDWWIRKKIERERITGLGPPALTLRTENAALDERLDRLFTEEDVRSALHDFNKRVVEARRQLLGGPPVVTPTRDVEAEVAAWGDRRRLRLSAARQRSLDEQARIEALPRRERRRARRSATRPHDSPSSE